MSQEVDMGEIQDITTEAQELPDQPIRIMTSNSTMANK